MAPPPVTEDYYMILKVGLTATLEQINKSYKRLALELHPDRNTKPDATEAFQLLGAAYETLKDETRRRDYDLLYPSIKRSHPSSANTQAPNSPPTWTPRSEALSDAAQLAVLDNHRFPELQRRIRQLELEIKILAKIEAAEAAQKNSWVAWLLSPVYRKPEESEEERERKDRARQERRIEKDMKERRLESRRTDLKNEQNLFIKAKEEVDAADLSDDVKIRTILARIWLRESLEREERERAERDKAARFWKEQQEQWAQQAREARERVEQLRRHQEGQRLKREQEAVEALRRRHAERQAAERKRNEEGIKIWQKILAEQAKRNRTQRTNFDFTEAYSGFFGNKQS
ncbi:hypothetical protein N0V90_002828 [Kalmusia sp. IMI 367209]|nr:hypothetical protein N0V90_002828 [Kalmusia sp. IMI 367209]